MAIKAETSLQKRIQDLIIKRGGYVNKNWGSMISKKGIADLTCGYKGFYLAIEVKNDKGKPSLAQGIHCRKVWHTGNIAMIVWSVEEVTKVLDYIDYCISGNCSIKYITNSIQNTMKQLNIDDGTRW